MDNNEQIMLAAIKELTSSSTSGLVRVIDLYNKVAKGQLSSANLFKKTMSSLANQGKIELRPDSNVGNPLSTSDKFYMLKSYDNTPLSYIRFLKEEKTIKKEFLSKKIHEYFNNNPNSKSFIMKIGDNSSTKTLWKIKKENKQFYITEVRTNKQKFILKEAPVGAQAPAAPMQGGPGMTQQQPRNSVQAKQANIQQFSQLDLPTKIAQLSTGMMLNYDTAVATLAQIVKDKSQDLVQLRRALESGTNAAPLDANQKRMVGNVLGILTSISNERALMASRSNKGKLLLKEEETPAEEPKKKASSEQDPKSDPVPKTRTEEQMLLAKSLTGQTIKAADIEVKPEGGILTLELVSISAPIQLKWFNNGKIVYNFKNRPYVIKK